MKLTPPAKDNDLPKMKHGLGNTGRFNNKFLYSALKFNNKFLYSALKLDSMRFTIAN